MPFFSHITRILRWGASILLCLLGCILLWQITQKLEYNIYDTYARWSSRQAGHSRRINHSPVHLILIDDLSIEHLRKKYGLPPWSRKAYVDIFKTLQDYQPATTVFDGHFMYFQRDNDRQTFESLRHIPNLILGVVHQTDTLHTASQWLDDHAGNYYLLNLGVININPDFQDGILRDIKPIWPATEATPGVFPALSLAAALDYQRKKDSSTDWILDWQEKPSQQLILYSEKAPNISKHYALFNNGTMLLHWQPLLSPQEKAKLGFSQLGMDISHPATPLWKAMLPKSTEEKIALKRILKDKIIVIGSASSIYHDVHHTPISIHHSGADVQATAIDNFLRLQPIYQIPLWWQIPISLGLLILACALRILVRDSQHSLLYILGSMTIYGWLAYWLFCRHQIWLPVATPEVALVLGFLIANVWLSLIQDNEVALLEGHLSRLVSQSVFQEIRHMSRIITQGGRKLDITAMMVDIRSFTSLAESLSPQQVTNLLNEFYELVVSTVFNYRGTVDKFLGDGVMILFGAPIPDANHAQDAVTAALELAKASNALIEKWKTERNIDTRIGISLHSGSAFVGFIGPKNKLEYTAIGDTVNICSRLQEHAKIHHSVIIISQDTLIQSPQHQQYFKPIGPVSIRGRDTTITIWECRRVPTRYS